MIEHIIIENYKSIRQLDLQLAPINILIGGNGAGKSNFISFFELINKIYEGKEREFSLKKGANSLLYRGIKHSEFIRGLIDFEDKNAYEFILSPLNDGALNLSKSTDYFNRGYGYNDDTKSYANKWHNQATSEPYRNATTGRGLFIKNYLNSFKVYHFHDTSESSPMKLSHPIDDNTYLREDASNLAAFLYFLQEKQPQQFKRIEMTVRSIAPFFDQFNLKPRSLNTDQIKLEWKEKESDMYLDAHSLSDGTLRFMALATLLLQPNPPKTIIIDEPELGLHPFAINKLASLIKKAAFHSQVIISTQSVELVNQFESENIVTVDRENGQSVFQRLDANDLSNWLKEFSLGDIWQKNIIGGQP